VESLHKLLDASHCLPEPYDLVVIDELPATFSQFFSPTVKNKRKNFEILSHLIRTAKKFAGYAADLSELDGEITKLLRGSAFEWTNSWPASPGVLRFEEKDSVMNQILSWLNQGKNVYVGSDSRRLLKSLMKKISPEIISRMYSSESCEAEKKELADPVSHWPQFRLVAATPIITHGVDFPTKHFDFQAYLCQGRSVVPRVIVQSLRRVRSVASGLTLFSLPLNSASADSGEEQHFGALNLLQYKVQDGKLMLDLNDPLTLLAHRTLSEMKSRATMMDAVSHYWKEAGGTTEIQVKNFLEGVEENLIRLGMTKVQDGWEGWICDGEKLEQHPIKKTKALKVMALKCNGKLVRVMRRRTGSTHKSLYKIVL
jgi:hypothetical protein